MKIQLDKNGSLPKLEKMLLEAEADDSVQAIMILACEANNFTPENSDTIFKNVSKPLFGGIFPQILHNTENLHQGTIVAGFTHKINPRILENISHADINLDNLLEEISQEMPAAGNTIFLFVDGMSRTIASLLDSTFNHLGLLSNYIGGGAGSLTFKPMPCVITGKGLLQDAAIFAYAEMGSGVGVAHGWHPVSEPLKITSSKHNSVVSLNWKPAFEVYREIIANVSDRNSHEITFETCAKSYPLGIVKIADELLVRDPVSCNDNVMTCLGELPQNSFVYVLKGDTSSLLAGAKKSRDIAEMIYYSRFDKSRESKSLTFFIDCITRMQFLGNHFKKELEIASGGNELIGALSLGEIANSGRDYLEFYNKTSVIAILED